MINWYTSPMMITKITTTLFFVRLLVETISFEPTKQNSLYTQHFKLTKKILIIKRMGTSVIFSLMSSPYLLKIQNWRVDCIKSFRRIQYVIVIKTRIKRMKRGRESEASSYYIKKVEMFFVWPLNLLSYPFLWSFSMVPWFFSTFVSHGVGFRLLFSPSS